MLGSRPASSRPLGLGDDPVPHHKMRIIDLRRRAVTQAQRYIDVLHTPPVPEDHVDVAPARTLNQTTAAAFAPQQLAPTELLRSFLSALRFEEAMRGTRGVAEGPQMCCVAHAEPFARAKILSGHMGMPNDETMQAMLVLGEFANMRPCGDATNDASLLTYDQLRATPGGEAFARSLRDSLPVKFQCDMISAARARTQKPSS